jgi:hypothetical protein
MVNSEATPQIDPRDTIVAVASASNFLSQDLGVRRVRRKYSAKAHRGHFGPFWRWSKMLASQQELSALF